MPAPRESLRAQTEERQVRARHPSHKLTAAIYCEVDGLPVEIEPLELSTAGLFVETPTPLSVDVEVEVFLRIGDMRFEAAGLVVQTVSCEQARNRRRKPGYGLLFMNVSDVARTELRRGIEALVVQRASAPRAPTPANPATAATPSKPAAPAATASRPATAATASRPATAAATASRPATAAATASRPATPPTTPVDPGEQAMLDKLRAELRALDAKPPWAVLGISQGANLVEAKQAFFDASKRYHPHLFARYAAAELKPLVTQLFIAHKRAYDTLRRSGKPQRQNGIEQGLPTVALGKPGSGNR